MDFMEVSVIIPVYNAAPFVEKAVRSALMQEEVKEVLVIDDGSTDGSWEILQKLMLDDDRVRLFQHPGGVNKGPGATRNVGLKSVRFEYVSFLDADDYYLADRFSETKATFLSHPDAGGVYEAVYLSKPVDDCPQLITFQKNIPPGECLERFLIGDLGYFSIVGLTVKTSVLRNLGITFRTDLRLAEDLDFIMEFCSRSSFYPGSLKDPVVIIQKHENNTTAVAYSIHSKYRHILFRDWVKKIMDHQWSGKLNRFLVKSYLAHIPVVYKLPVSSTLKKFIKAFCLILLLLRFPRLITKVLAP
ncbi:MAG: glycosyltransferase family 2 protein [Phaeodactylibacter sp.]|nr:glycosyltransferase family 2 protein [Phaeodactylibacter sp.]